MRGEKSHLASHCGVIRTDDDQRWRNVETLHVREVTQLRADSAPSSESLDALHADGALLSIMHCPKRCEREVSSLRSCVRGAADSCDLYKATAGLARCWRAHESSKHGWCTLTWVYTISNIFRPKCRAQLTKLHALTCGCTFTPAGVMYTPIGFTETP